MGGCCDSTHDTQIIQIAYCGGCGWSIPAKRICDEIRQRLPKAIMDCRPQQQYTGVLVISLLLKNQRKIVFKGDKETVAANAQKIANSVVEEYNKG